jgi:hypothetical protein
MKAIVDLDLPRALCEATVAALREHRQRDWCAEGHAVQVNRRVVAKGAASA